MIPVTLGGDDLQQTSFGVIRSNGFAFAKRVRRYFSKRHEMSMLGPFKA